MKGFLSCEKEKREGPTPGAYFSSDSPSHSLYAGSVMTPSMHHVQRGTKYLGLPVKDLAYCVPYRCAN